MKQALLLWIALLAACLKPASGFAGAPQRIVSLNLCADQYLIALADKKQIAALTHHARNPALSYFAGKAQRYPISNGSGEEVLRLKPDLVVVSPFRRAETRALLKEFDLPMLKVGAARSVDAIIDQTRMIAEAIGHPARGEALIAQIEASRETSSLDAASPHPSLHYQRRGFLTGERALITEIMTYAGLQNLAGEAGAQRLARVSIETLLKLQPLYIVTKHPVGQFDDLGTEPLEHPALKRFFGPDHRLYLPEALSVCGGPSFPEAVQALRAQVARPE